jgi:hypothetical protein
MAPEQAGDTASDLPGFYTSGGVGGGRPSRIRSGGSAGRTCPDPGGGIHRGGGIRGGADGFWWWWVLLAAAGLAVAELAIGNRTQRH